MVILGNRYLEVVGTYTLKGTFTLERHLLAYYSHLICSALLYDFYSMTVNLR